LFSFIDKPPSYGDTCPGNMVIPMTSCSVESRGLWSPPTWLDDHTREFWWYNVLRIYV